MEKAERALVEKCAKAFADDFENALCKTTRKRKQVNGRRITCEELYTEENIPPLIGFELSEWAIWCTMRWVKRYVMQQGFKVHDVALHPLGFFQVWLIRPREQS